MMSADNVLIIVKGKRHPEYEDEEKYLIFEESMSSLFHHFSDNMTDQTNEKGLKWCLEGFRGEWWEIEAFDTLEEALDRCEALCEEYYVEYGFEDWTE